jgi:hypothetical protein
VTVAAQAIEAGEQAERILRPGRAVAGGAVAVGEGGVERLAEAVGEGGVERLAEETRLGRGVWIVALLAVRLLDRIAPVLAAE